MGLRSHHQGEGSAAPAGRGSEALEADTHPLGSARRPPRICYLTHGSKFGYFHFSSFRLLRQGKKVYGMRGVNTAIWFFLEGFMPEIDRRQLMVGACSLAVSAAFPVGLGSFGTEFFGLDFGARPDFNVAVLVQYDKGRLLVREISCFEMFVGPEP